MNFLILFWNVRGMGSVEKCLQIKHIVNSSSVELLVLQGTKLKSIHRPFLRQILSFALVNGICLPSRGFARGIWVVWNTGKIEVLQSWVNNFSVSVRRRRRVSDDEWVVPGVYGLCVSN